MAKTAKKIFFVTATISLWCNCVAICPEGEYNFCMKCPPGFINLYRGCYFFSNTSSTWMEGIKLCTNLHSRLVSVESEEESVAIKQYMRTIKQDHVAGYWTSGSDLYSLNNFVWFSTGEPVYIYKNWCPTQPDNAKQNCIYLWYWKDREICWDNGFCTWNEINKNKLLYICEYVPRIA